MGSKTDEVRGTAQEVGKWGDEGQGERMQGVHREKERRAGRNKGARKGKGREKAREKRKSRT